MIGPNADIFDMHPGKEYDAVRQNERLVFVAKFTKSVDVEKHIEETWGDANYWGAYPHWRYRTVLGKLQFAGSLGEGNLEVAAAGRTSDGYFLLVCNAKAEGITFSQQAVHDDFETLLARLLLGRRFSFVCDNETCFMGRYE
jgi:hypothetical protein